MTFMALIFFVLAIMTFGFGLAEALIINDRFGNKRYPDEATVRWINDIVKILIFFAIFFQVVN